MAFSTNDSSGRTSLSAQINVTPLIDVLLVMLIIFMVIVPVVPRGLNSIIPSTSRASASDEVVNHPILVQIELDGSLPRYKIDGAGVAQADVAPRLKGLAFAKVCSQEGTRKSRCEARFQCCRGSNQLRPGRRRRICRIADPWD